MPLQALERYDISARTGFVPESDPLERLAPMYAPWEETAASLSSLIRTRRLRTMVRAWPVLDTALLHSEPERERALLLLTMFANAWVWGDDTPDLSIPPSVAVPLCTLADAMRRPAIVHYGCMSLRNWRRIDRGAPVSADNATMQVQFLGGVDEDWFFIGSLGVELAGAPLIVAIERAVLASHGADDTTLARALEALAQSLEPVIAALERVTQWCDPHVFYHRVRPYLAGWPSPGAIYRGVSDSPRMYVGGSAGQSSLIQAVDAALGVTHQPAPVHGYLMLLRGYMPAGHRGFIEDLERDSRIRARAGAGGRALREAYDAAIDRLVRFRQSHVDITVRYIVEPSGAASGQKGTGGTEAMSFLNATRDSTRAARLGG